MAMFRRRRWPWAVAAAVVLGVAVLVVALVTRDDEGPVADDPVITRSGDPVPDPTPPSVPLATVLAAPDGKLKAYAESTVTADGVPVLSVVGPSAAWIGTSPAERVLVVLVSSTAEGFSFKPGARLSFTGAVREVAPGFGTSLGLEGADNAEFDRQGAYVEVSEYDVG